MMVAPVNLALGKLRKDYFQMFVASLNYIGNSKLAWATDVRICVKKRKTLYHMVRCSICDSTGIKQHCS